MKSKKIITGIGASVIALGLVMPVSALTVDSALDAAGDVSATVTDSIGVGSSANVNGSAQSSTTGSGSSGTVSGSARASTDANVGFGSSIKAMLSGLVNGTVSGSADAETADGTDQDSSASVGLGTVLETILVTRADIASGKVQATSDNTFAVGSDADLKGFIAAHVQNDSNVEAIEYTSDTISVTYSDKARLFAILPVTVQATATVDANGSVEVSYPWYSFLMATNKDAIEAKVQQRVQGVLGAAAGTGADARAAADAQAALQAENGSVNVDAGASAEAAARLTAQAQARLIAEVKAAMAEALADAESATDVQADVRADANAAGAIDVR